LDIDTIDSNMHDKSSNSIQKNQTVFQSNSVKSPKGQFEKELVRVVWKSDYELLEFAKHLNKIVVPFDFVHSNSWNCPLSIKDDCLIRYRVYDFFNLNPMQKHLEMLRAEAEATVIHSKLGFRTLAQWEKNSLMQRALSILPQSMVEQFSEIITCPGFRTGSELQKIQQNAEKLTKALQSIENEFGKVTALAFGLLIQYGIKNRNEFEYYGQKLDKILRKVANLPQIQELQDNRRYENSFGAQYIFLSTLRDRILKLLPHRKLDEKKFLLIDLLEIDWEITQEISGSEIVFTALDSLILSWFGFENSCVYLNNNLMLEVVTTEKVIYWEPLTNSPITYSAPAIKHRYNFMLLIALTYSKIADVHVQMGRDLEKAIGLYEKAIELIPALPDLYTNLAQVYIKINSPKQAIPYIKKAIEINEESAEYHHLLGLAYCLISDWPSAIMTLRRAVGLRPSYIEAYNNLAYAYEQNNDYNKAEDAYQQMLLYKPNYFEAFFGLGNIYFNRKQYDQAVLYFERALKINPQSERAYYNLGQSYYEKGELDTSIKIYKELLRMNPNHAAAWNNLGVIYRNKGMKKEAVKCLEQAVRFNPILIK
jgi:tetratricopeptide (TPR) repeat protein